MARKKAATEEKSSSYIALKAVRHDGERYEIGETVELTPTQAAELLNLEAIQPVKADNAE